MSFLTVPKDHFLLKLSPKFNADRLGILISALCALHCLLVPIVAISSSYLSFFIGNHYVHSFLLAALLPISFIAFIKQQRSHQKWSPAILGTTGLIFLFTALLFGEHIDAFPYPEEILSTIGSLVLIAAHILNIKHLTNCRQCSHH